MLTIIPNFLEEHTLTEFISNLDRSKSEPVDYSPNVRTIKYSSLPLKKVAEKGNVTFTEVLLYTNGAFSPPHVDYGPIDQWKAWKATGILFCTDNYEGGDIFFPKLNVIMKPKKNTFVMFPAGVGTELYEHGVNPVLAGERITTIFRFVE